MRILITGSSGMLGTDLTAALTPHHDVYGAGLLTSSQPHYRQIDLSERRNAAELFSEIKPDIVFHTAAMTDVDGCESKRREAMLANFEMTRHLTDESNRYGACLVFFSTDYVFDGTKKGEYLETDPVCPVNFYGETKALAENYIQKHAEKYVIFRITWLYGLNGKSFPRTILNLAQKQKKFEIVSDQAGRPTYTRDLVRALAALLSKDPLIFHTKGNTIYHLCNGGQTDWAGFASEIFKQSGHADIEVVPIDSTRLNRPAKRPANSVLSIDKAASALGIRLRPWQEAVGEFIAEYKAESLQEKKS